MNLIDSNVQAEYSIIGSIIMDHKLVSELTDVLRSNDFSYRLLGQIYDYAINCYLSNEIFEVVTAVEFLKSIGIEQSSAMELCVKCSNNIQTKETIKRYAELVVELSRKRKIKAIAAELLNSTDDSDVMVTDAIVKLNDVNKGKADSSLYSLEESVLNYINYLGNEEDGSKVDTGFYKLDKNLMGMRGGELIILAARPACGKSAFSLNIGLNAARYKKRVIAFSQEMKSDELVERMMASGTGISMNLLINKFNGVTEEAKDKHWQSIMSYGNHLSRLPMHIFDNAFVTPLMIKNICLKFSDLSLVIVDYLQLIRTNKRYGNKNLEIGDITRDLKMLAMELDVPILLLSQLNRSARETEKPSLTDLRDSGEIEQNANKVIMIWKTDVDEGNIGVYIPKNRRGNNGTVEFRFDGEHMRYEELKTDYKPREENKRYSVEY
jgi:replicative DNA helicase